MVVTFGDYLPLLVTSVRRLQAVAARRVNFTFSPLGQLLVAKPGRDLSWAAEFALMSAEAAVMESVCAEACGKAVLWYYSCCLIT